MPLLSEIDGWTPIIDDLAKERGLVSAAVFGIVWRHCQLDDGVCYASMETLSEKLGIDRATILRHIKKLCEDGYLVDTTPGKRNAPHVYADTGKAGLVGEIKTKSKQTVAQNNTSTVAQNNSQTPKPAKKRKTVAQDNATVAESQLKRLFKRHANNNNDNNIDSTSESSPTPSRQMFSALADLVKFDLDLLGETQRGKLNQAEKKMRDKGYTPADLEAFGLWWYASDWRGKQGQPPKLNDIRETWGQFKESRNKATAPAALAPELPPPPILTPEQLTLQAAQAVLRQQMTRQTYDDLIRGVTTLPRTNGTFNLVAATEQARDLIQHRLYKTVAAVFKTIDPTIKEIEVMI